MSRRQAIRRVLLLLAFISFPLTMNYFSPYLIVDGAFNGIVTGSLIVFASMFAGSLIFGRALVRMGVSRPQDSRSRSCG